ncbi:MAG: cytochrome C oxidase subunit IV family protein [Actinomycetota bacterium]
MSTTTEPVEPAADHDIVHAVDTLNETHAHDGEHIPKDGYFIRVALILAFVTALETSTYWWPSSMKGFATPALLIMMTIKFFMILLVFMHLKFDNKLFSLMFYIGLGLAIFVYTVALFTFQFFRQ